MCVQDKTVQTISPSKCHSEAQPEVLGTVTCHNRAQGGRRLGAVTVSLSWHYRALPWVPGGGEALVVVVLEGVKGARYLMQVLRANTKGCSPLLWVQLLGNDVKAGPLWGHQVGEGGNEPEVRGQSVSQLEREAQFTRPSPQGRSLSIVSRESIGFHGFYSFSQPTFIEYLLYASAINKCWLVNKSKSLV